MEPKIPAWVTTLLAFLSLTPAGPTVKEVALALEDGQVTIPEVGDILAAAADNASSLLPGDRPEEALAMSVTRALAIYFHQKFPPPAINPEPVNPTL